jgi:hypothetical protein
MDPRAGQALAAELDAKRRRACASDHAVEVVGDSGHFVFIEQPAPFNKALLGALSHCGSRRVQRAADAAASAAAAAAGDKVAGVTPGDKAAGPAAP